MRNNRNSIKFYNFSALENNLQIVFKNDFQLCTNEVQ